MHKCFEACQADDLTSSIFTQSHKKKLAVVKDLIKVLVAKGDIQEAEELKEEFSLR
jgi:hypothetical protein